VKATEEENQEAHQIAVMREEKDKRETKGARKLRNTRKTNTDINTMQRGSEAGHESIN
jgi:hypothetical protein